MTDTRLQHFIFPGQPDRPMCLYAREQPPGILATGSLSFDTYFNSFSIRKWRRYTDLSNLWLGLRMRGRFSCRVIGLDARGRETVLAERDCDFSSPATMEIPVDAPEDVCLVFCRFYFSDARNFEFLEGEFFTRSDAPEYVNITAIFCTYNREPYLEKNVLAIRDALAANEIMRCHFRVLIIDNGSNLDAEKYAANGARLLHNINAGGSGGFTRGMLELLDQPDTDYALTLDDDIELEPESLFRMLVFLSFLKAEYREYFLGGTMFGMQSRAMQRCWRECCKPGDFYIRGLNYDLNMCSRRNILLGATLFEIDNQYNGWWMCCIPLSVIRRQGLPIPFFLKFDDIEYAMRNGSRIMQLNGICVWHEDFMQKYSPVTEFLDRKNCMVTALLTAPDPAHIARSLRSLWRISARRLLRLDYDFFEAHLLALSMLRQGPAHLDSFAGTVRAIRQLREHRAEQILDWDSYQRLSDQCGTYRPSSRLFKKMIMAATLAGNFLPAFLTRKRMIIAGLPSITEVFLADEIFVLNKHTHSAEIWRRDRKRFFRLLASYSREWLLFMLCRKRLMAAYRRERQRLCSRDFWVKYLRLDARDYN